VLGLLPGATPDQVERAYAAKAGLLRPEFLSGAPSPAVTAASRAQALLDAARRELAEPAARARYDLAAGLRGRGEGLARRESVPSAPAPALADDAGFFAGLVGDELPGLMEAVAGWLAPRPSRRGRVEVPDVRGLFYSVCLVVAGRRGLHVTAVRLTGHPRPVDGLVVGQEPRAPARARRGARLTVQVWHPAA
jgi:hypothetical protein